MITEAANHSIKTENGSMSGRYYASLHFPKQLKEYSDDFLLQAKSYRTGQHIGQVVNPLMPYFLIIAIAITAVLVYIRIYRKKRSAAGKRC